jgi:hypothetical protein
VRWGLSLEDMDVICCTHGTQTGARPSARLG